MQEQDEYDMVMGVIAEQDRLDNEMVMSILAEQDRIDNEKLEKQKQQIEEEYKYQIKYEQMSNIQSCKNKCESFEIKELLWKNKSTYKIIKTCEQPMYFMCNDVSYFGNLKCVRQMIDYLQTGQLTRTYAYMSLGKDYRVFYLELLQKMFGVQKMLGFLKGQYLIEFKDMWKDVSEFRVQSTSQNKKYEISIIQVRLMIQSSKDDMMGVVVQVSTTIQTGKVFLRMFFSEYFKNQGFQDTIIDQNIYQHVSGENQDTMEYDWFYIVRVIWGAYLKDIVEKDDNGRYY